MNVNDVALSRGASAYYVVNRLGSHVAVFVLLHAIVNVAWNSMVATIDSDGGIQIIGAKWFPSSMEPMLDACMALFGYTFLKT